MAAGGDDRIVLGRDREGPGSNQAEEENRNGLLLVVRQMESSS
jgi:hypothetical protein